VSVRAEQGVPAWDRRGWADLRLGLMYRVGLIPFREMTSGVAAGSRFYAGPSNAEYGTGANELPVQSALAGQLRPGMTFFDVGANVGFFTVIGARLVGPSGKVFAFEPVAQNAAHVRLNCRANRLENVQVIVGAVGDVSGEGTLMRARYSGGAVLESAGKPPDFLRAESTRILRLDDWVEAGTLPVPHAIKVDVEGAELQVLKGARETLARHFPAVIFEVDGPDGTTVDVQNSSCSEFLRSLGYSVTELQNSYPGIDWVVRHGLAVRA
jgi:FkbM family methyltransferase